MIYIFVCINSETELGSMKINEMGETGKNTQRKKREHEEEISATEHVHAKKSVGKKKGVERTEINLLNNPS